MKIGGSLTRGAAPRALLAHLARRKGLVVVPGGGALADAVRAVQPQWGIGDRAAHRMALLSMEQMAHAMHDIEPRLLPARNLTELGIAALTGAALWFPVELTLGHPAIAESWDVTSDSLALWLAAEMGAPRLVLVKAPGLALPSPSGTRAGDIAAWTAHGLVDAAFATMAHRFSGDILLFPADAANRLDDALRLEDAAGRTAENENEKEGAPPAMTSHSHRAKAPRWAWALTGSGHYFTESLEIIRELQDVDLFISDAAAEVLRMYKQDKEPLPEQTQVFHDQSASSASISRFYHGEYHTLIVSPASSNTVAKAVHGISDTLVTNCFAQAGKCRVHCIVFACDTQPEMITMAPEGPVPVYPRRIDLENTRRLKEFDDTVVAETVEELRLAIARRREELARLANPPAG